MFKGLGFRLLGQGFKGSDVTEISLQNMGGSICKQRDNGLPHALDAHSTDYQNNTGNHRDGCMILCRRLVVCSDPKP